MAVIDRAFIEILPQLAQFERSLREQFDDVFRILDDQTREAAQVIERQLEKTDVFSSLKHQADEAARDVERQLEDIDIDHGAVTRSLMTEFERIEDAAQRSGEELEDAFNEAQRSSSRSLRGIGVAAAGAFTPIVAGARTAAAGVTSAFRTAAVASGTALSGVGVAAAGVGARLGAGIAAGAAIAGQGMVLLGGAAAFMGIKTSASLEQADIAFTQLLHSGERAQAFLGDLQKFAASTPFELPGLIDVSRQLIGAGAAAGDVIPTLRAWGDATGALGLGQEQFNRIMLAVTQSMNKGKVQAEELMQITEAGIPVYPLLAKAMNTTVPELQKLASSGKLLAADVFPALEKQMSRDYGGAMGKQSKTLTGLWSTLMDTVNIGLANTLEPLIPALKEGVAGAIEFLGRAFVRLPGYITGAVATIGTVKTAVEGLLDLLVRGDFSKKFADAFNVSEDSNTVRVILAIRNAVMVTSAFLTETAFPAISSAVSVTARFITESLVPGFQRLITFIREDVAPVLERIGRFLYETFLPTFRALGRFFTESLAPAFEDIHKALSDNAPALLTVARAVGTLIGFVLAVQAHLAGKLLPILITVAGYLTRGVVLAVVLVINILGRLIRFVQSTWATFQLFQRVLSAVWETITVRTRAAVGLISAAITSWIRTLRSRVIGFFTTARNWIVGGGRAIFQGLWNGMIAVWRSVTGWLGDRRRITTGFFSAAHRWLLSAGRDVLNGFWDGLKAVWKNVKDWFMAIPGWIKDHKGPLSLDRTILVDAGRAIMQGFYTGLKSGSSSAFNFVKGIVGDIGSLLGDVASGDLVGNLTGNLAGAGSTSGNRSIGKRLAAQLYGWTGQQWMALERLWTGESNWNNLADNPTSTAFGIPQFLNATAAQYGALGSRDPATQIIAGMRYIKDVYGSPLGALSAWSGRSPHWYESGKWDVPWDQLAFVHRGEMIVPEAPADRFRGELSTSRSSGRDDRLTVDDLRQAMAGLALRFDGDGLARFVDDRLAIGRRKGGRA